MRWEVASLTGLLALVGCDGQPVQSCPLSTTLVDLSPPELQTYIVLDQAPQSAGPVRLEANKVPGGTRFSLFLSGPGSQQVALVSEAPFVTPPALLCVHPPCKGISLTQDNRRSTLARCSDVDVTLSVTITTRLGLDVQTNESPARVTYMNLVLEADGGNPQPTEVSTPSEQPRWFVGYRLP